MHGIVKQTLEALAGPLQLALLLAVAAAACRKWQRPKLGRGLLLAALVVAYCSASPIVGDALIGPLERAYPPLSDTMPLPKPGYIAVLGAGYQPRDNLAVTAALNREGVVRVVEAIRLMRIFGIEKLIVSGGAPPQLGRSALGYAQLARNFGVPDSSIIILDQPQTTAAEARSIADLLGNSPFILVTSGAHMPRAMRLMARVGARAIPAPAAQLAISAPFTLDRLIPDSAGMHKVEAATHEYLGLLALAAGLE